MNKIEKTVFISYRRTNSFMALAIFKDLTAHGYDVFFDYTSIASGDFEQIIISNIKSRAHFIVILTPSALDRCSNPNDWFRREIETALQTQRNIVPLTFENFDFNSPEIAKHLTGELANLSKYNGLRVPADFFDAAMQRLRNDFLNIPIKKVYHPPLSNIAAKAAKQQQIAASKSSPVTQKQLSANEWFEQGYTVSDPDERIRIYTKTIQLDPKFARAYNNRAVAYSEKGNFDAAIQDYDQAIQLIPKRAAVYNNRGIAHSAKRNFDAAIQDYDRAIQLDPKYAIAYNNRGIAHSAKRNFDAAIQDYDQAIQLDPKCAKAYYNRGNAYKFKGDINAIFRQSLQSDPRYAAVYRNQGNTLKTKGNPYYEAAIKDYENYLAVGGGGQYNNQVETEKIIRDLKQQLV